MESCDYGQKISKTRLDGVKQHRDKDDRLFVTFMGVGRGD